MLSYVGCAYGRGPSFLKGPFLLALYHASIKPPPLSFRGTYACIHPEFLSSLHLWVGCSAISNIPDAAPEGQAREGKWEKEGREREYVSLLESVTLVIEC